MEPYEVDPDSSESEKRLIPPRRPEAGGPQSSTNSMDLSATTGGGLSTPAHGPHRSYVARQFLAGIHEDGDDFEDTPLTLMEGGASNHSPTVRSENSGNSNGGVGGTTAVPAPITHRFFQRREELDKVDQSINLMDAKKAKYEAKRKKRTSLVDILLHSDHEDFRGRDTRHHTGEINGATPRKPQQSEPNKCREVFCRKWFLLLLAFLALGGLLAFGGSVLFGHLGIGKKNNNAASASAETDQQNQNSQPRPLPKLPIVPQSQNISQNTSQADGDRVTLLKLRAETVTSKEDLDNNATHAHSALHWLTEDDRAKLDFNDPGLLQRYALVVFYFSTQPAIQKGAVYRDWTTKENWMSKANVCEWYGVACEEVHGHNVVVHLNLTANQLVGNIPSKFATHNVV